MTQQTPAPLRTVLIATSSACDLAGLRQILARYGFQLLAFSTGADVLKAAGASDVALALLDVTMAGSDDFELCRHLQRRHGQPLPVFLLSAQPGDDERRRAVEAGAHAYLPLPFHADDIAEKILLELGVLSPRPQAPGMPAMATLQVSYHAMLSGSPDAVLLVEREHFRVLDANRSARKLFGRTQTELLQAELLSLCPPEQADGRSSAEALAGYTARVMAGDVGVFDMNFLHSGGRPVVCELRMVPLNAQEHRLMHIRLVDVSARKHATDLRDGKNALLEMIAGGAPLQETLDRLMLLIESQSEGVLCTVMLLAPDGVSIVPGAGPSLPLDYLAALRGLSIGPAAGSCGTAMFRKATVTVPDIANDPLWTPYRHIAASHGLRACWATPILFEGDTVLGSFAMYYREVRSPTAEDRSLISAATHLAGIAIAAAHRQEELRRHRLHLEELVSARTTELRLAKQDTKHIHEELSTALDSLSLTQEELVRRDKLAALGALVAGVAHELNTPIGNSLMMASSMSERSAQLRRELADGLRRSALETYLEQAASADEVLLRNLNKAASLVEGFKRIAVDAAGLQRRRFVLDELLAELVDAWQPAARKAGLSLTMDVAPGLALDSYPALLAEALGHLFANSMAHAYPAQDGDQQQRARPGHGVISLRGHATGQDEIALSFSDDGAGIPPDDLQRIYDPFFTTTLGSGGSGLGLYITHNIITGVLKGRIDARSAPRKGTTFTLRLPRVATP